MATLTPRIRSMATAVAAVLMGLFFLYASIATIAWIYYCLSPRGDDEFYWMKRARYSLDGIRDAMNCFELCSGALPADAASLLRSGCLVDGTSFEPAIAGVFELPLANHPNWDRVDQLLIRRDAHLISMPGEIVAVVLPDKRYREKCAVLRRDGTVEFVIYDEWKIGRDAWRNRLGGTDLWQ